jgi:pyruvate,water dikinase
MTFITPLHLTNPEAPDFTPQGCRTLHDITRFAHEIAVKEMFAFDKKQAFSRYFIKRLATPVALEWWVLNLEDGFKEEVSDKQVELRRTTPGGSGGPNSWRRSWSGTTSRWM